MKRFFFVVLTLVFFIVSVSSISAEEDYVFTNPWQNSEMSAYELIKDGYRLVSVQAPPFSPAEILYLQKKISSIGAPLIKTKEAWLSIIANY